MALGSLITRSDIPAELRPGLKAMAYEFKYYPDVWKEIFELHTSDKAVEFESTMYQFRPAAVKEEGDGGLMSDSGELYTTSYYHKTFSIGYAISFEAVDDNLYQSQWPLSTKALMTSHRISQNVQAASVFNNGFTTSFPGGDGVPLFSASHPTIMGTTANTFTVQMDFSQQGVQDGILLIQYLRDSAGNLAMVTPKRLLTAPQNQFAASQVVNSSFTPYSANNAINPIVHDKYLPEGHLTWHYITNPELWAITTDQPEGLKYMQRMPLKMQVFTDVYTANTVCNSFMRYSYMWTDFRAVVGSSGAVV